VHYYDPHDPYIARPEFSMPEKLPEGLHHGERIDRYDQEIRYTDRQIQELYTLLEKKGLGDNLLTCITSDHGEQFGEHGYLDGLGHNDTYAETTLVPLIFHGPGVPRNQQIETFVSTMDIGTTLPAAAGLKFDYVGDGLDLLAKVRNNEFRNNKTPDRQTLIIGTQKFSRSPQLLAPPHAYFLNLDNHHKYWYLSCRPGDEPLLKVEADRFTPFPAKQLHKTGLALVATLPDITAQGLQYAVIRGRVKQGAGSDNQLLIKTALFPKLSSRLQPVTIPAQKKDTRMLLEIIYPVSIVDRLSINTKIQKENGALLDDMRYAILPAAEVAALLPTDYQTLNHIRQKSQLWKNLLTKRKQENTDEFYDFSSDPDMQKNLMDAPTLKPLIIDSRKLLYKAYRYYLKKRHLLFSGSKSKLNMSEEDKKVLKSLGYL